MPKCDSPIIQSDHEDDKRRYTAKAVYLLFVCVCACLIADGAQILAALFCGLKRILLVGRILLYDDILGACLLCGGKDSGNR